MTSRQLRSTFLKCVVWVISAAVCVIALSMCFSDDFRANSSSAATPLPTVNAEITTGVNASLHGKQIFAPDDAWNTDISKEPCDPTSDAIIAGIGLDRGLHPDFGASYGGGPFGIAYIVVTGQQPRVPIAFDYADQSDPGPYPVPPDAPIEGGAKSDGDRHVIVIDRDNWMLYELYGSIPEIDSGRWRASSGAVFDLGRISVQRRPGWTSADAAGLPIFSGLIRYDEVVEQGKITHALRFTARHTRRAFVLPATHFASKGMSEDLPPMGMRMRLKADYDISGFPPSARVILQALKTYGMILADNGGNWFISGTADARWNDAELNTLKSVKGSAFEVVRMGQIVTRVE
jgi:hypothetical protein